MHVKLKVARPRDLHALKEWVGARPMTLAMGLTCEDIEVGRAVFRFEPPMDWRNPNGSLPGALVLAAADYSAGMAAASVTSVDDYVSTVDLGLHFLRPAFKTPVRSRTDVLRVGARLVFLETQVTDAEEEVFATGVGSYAVARGDGQQYPIGADAEQELAAHDG